MKSSLLKIAMIAALAGMPVCLFAQTGAEPASADAAASLFHSSRPYAIEGVWDENVTLTNCDTGATLASFRALDMFIHGGALTDTNSAPPPRARPRLRRLVA
ncbi:hypothetical protein [Rudaea sp.]|uniref:hypothetical protein n=1 Tax=Rudaea sp. TaxID=2136325 RepID=UPI002ED6A93D